jgi:membrane protease YdiL (CAAX protease family)
MEKKIYPGLKNSILLTLLLLGVQIGFGIIVGLIQALLQISNESLTVGVLTGFGNLIAFGLVIFIGFKKSRRTFQEIFKFNNVSLSLWLSVIIFMIGFVIVTSELDNILNYILPMPDLLKNIFDSIMAKDAFIVSLIVMGILPGFLEEMFFRGVILNGLSKNYSMRKAIIVSSLLFGIVHLNPWQFYAAFIIGLITARLYLRTNSILLGIYIHMFNNILYTIVVRYREYMPIKGFNTNFATPVVFQPFWFDIIGAVILVIGIILLLRSVKSAKNFA